MKKLKEDKPLEYYERSYVWIVACLAILGILGYLIYGYIKDVNPIGSILMALPTLIMLFFTMWILLNPFAIIYEDKFEVQNTMVTNKVWHFIDIKKVSEIKGGTFIITYNDDDEERIRIWGIRPSHKQKFRNAVNHYVCKSFVERED